MFEGHYDNWRISRFNGLFKILDKSFFKGKTVLELGCGTGKNGQILEDIGAEVTFSDARKEYLDTIYRPENKKIILDLDNDLIKDEFDIILHFGVLYHLKNIDSHLKNVSNKCNILILETEVLDSLEDEAVNTSESGYDQAFNSIGIRPSPSYIENILTENGFDDIKLIKDKDLNSGFHIYDWEHKNDKTHKDGLRRFWVCRKSVVPGLTFPPSVFIS